MYVVYRYNFKIIRKIDKIQNFALELSTMAIEILGLRNMPYKSTKEAMQ